MRMSDHPRLVSIHTALKRVAENRPSLGVEAIALDDCLGRTVANDVFAEVTVPPLDASAMDGYAVRYEDVRERGARLNVLGEVAAGSPNAFSIDAGEAVRVFTGAPMPAGADHILIQEHADIGDDEVVVTHGQAMARHIRKAGGDFHQGDRILHAGTRLSPRHIGVAASANHGSLSVYRRPSVAILTAGSELRPPGSSLSDGQIAESNSYTLSKLLESQGAKVSRLSTAPDDERSISSKFEEAANADIIVTVGGASVGKHDLVRTVFSQRGGEYVFERIAVRPGKPTWFGKLGDQTILGLPGNPTAAFVMLSLLMKGLMFGSNSIEFTDAFLATQLPANGPRETFVRGRVDLEKGKARVHALNDQDTSRVYSLTSTNCLIHRPGDAPQKSTGELLQIVMLD
ncbi:MAG: gephyrin-like molybdotransferase Glp [Pseudomonadota bacterium]